MFVCISGSLFGKVSIIQHHRFPQNHIWPVLRFKLPSVPRVKEITNMFTAHNLSSCTISIVWMLVD